MTPTSEAAVLSIIIPSFNTSALTQRCVEALLTLEGAGQYEIIVVDNHSSDGTVEALKQRFPQIRVIANENNEGYSRACNAGAKAAQGQTLLFLNSDTLPLPGSFETLLAHLKDHPKTGIVGPLLVQEGGAITQLSWGQRPILWGEWFQSYFASEKVERSPLRRRLVNRLQRKSRPVPFICGACLMIRRDTFNQIGGFDDTYELYFEDSDICARAWKAGWIVDFVPAKVVHHLSRSTSSWGWERSLVYQQSHVTYYRRHGGFFANAVLKLYLLIKGVKLYVQSRLSGGQSPSRAYVSLYADILFERRHIRLHELVR